MQNYNPLERQFDTKVKHAQVIYLDKVLNKPIGEIAEITDYAESTVKGYIRKYEHLLEWAKEIFSKVKDVFYAWQGKRKSPTFDNRIFIAKDLDLLDGEKKQKCYLVSFYNDNDELICSKVGTTTEKYMVDRIKSELRSDTYKKRDCTKVKIHRVYDCKEVPAEGLESYFRALYIRDYPTKFNKNDRFFDVEFDLEEADKFVAEYYKSA